MCFSLQNEIDLCSLHVKYEPVLSPLSLHMKLVDLIEQINTILHHTTQ